MSYPPITFLLSLMMPIVFQVGPMALMPHRLLLLLLFFPLFFQLIAGKAGPLSAIDFAVLFSVVWATLSILVSIGDGKVQAAGIYWIEFFGAYLVGRVCIRSGQDYIRFVAFYFIVMRSCCPTS